MKKRVLSCFIAAVMMLSAVWITSLEPASAASQKPFMSVQADSDGTPRDKVGKYYIWVEYKNNKSLLKCAKSLKGKKTTLKKVAQKNSGYLGLGATVLTDGNTIYYSVSNYNGDQSLGSISIYKTTVKNAKHKKIATIKRKGASFDLAAYYNGKLYYKAYLYSPEDTIEVYSYDISKKKKKLIIDGGWYPYDSYGQHILVCGWNNAAYNAIYNMKTNKLKELPYKIMTSGGTIYGKTIYYTENDEETNTTLVRKCNLSGKKIKTIKKLKNAEIVHLGKKAVYYRTGSSKKVKKLTYQ